MPLTKKQKDLAKKNFSEIQAEAKKIWDTGKFKTYPEAISKAAKNLKSK